MSILTEEKQKLADIISDIIPALPYIPGRVNPGTCIINPGSPYLQSGNTYRSFLVTVGADLIFPAQPNDRYTQEMDETVNSIIELLIAEGYGISEVSQPVLIDVSNAQYLTVTIQVTFTVTIT
jgi:hypothetical protein